MQRAHSTHRFATTAGILLLSAVLVGLPAAAQEHEADEHGTETEAGATTHKEHGEEGDHHGHSYHPNEIGFFAGITDDHY